MVVIPGPCRDNRRRGALNRGVTRAPKAKCGNGPCTSAYWPRGAPQKRKRANGETRVRVRARISPIALHRFVIAIELNWNISL